MTLIAMATCHTLMCAGMVGFTKNLEGYNVIIQSSTGEKLIAEIEASAVLPDLCIIGAAPEGIRGFATVKQIKSKWPDMKVLVLTASRSPIMLMFMIHYGATSLINTTATEAELKYAIDATCQGCFCFPDDMKNELNLLQKKRRRIRSILIFSATQCDVIELLCKQYIAKEIARIMQITTNTVNTQLKRIYGKLNISSKQELLLLLRDAGFDMA